jgi:hypothetical protein
MGSFGVWTKISLEEAQKHPLYGRSGGALVLAVYLVLIFCGYFALAAAATSPNHPPKPGGLAVILLAFIIYRLFRKRPCRTLIDGSALLILGATVLTLLIYFLNTDKYINDTLLDASLTGIAFAIVVSLPAVAFAHTSRPFRVTYESEVRSDDPFLAGVEFDRKATEFSAKASFSGTSKAAGDGFRTVRCNNCNCLNRVSTYSLKLVPICGNPNCRQPLQEPAWKRLLRFGYTNPLFLMGLGIALAVMGFLFLDRYWPSMGLIWNIINGKIGGLEYRYVLSISVLIFLLGGYLWARK